MKALWIIVAACAVAGCDGHSLTRPASNTGFPIHEAITQLRGELAKAQLDCMGADPKPTGSIEAPEGKVKYKCDSGLGLTEVDMTFELSAAVEAKGEVGGGISHIWSLTVSDDRTQGNKNSLTLKFALPSVPVTRNRDGDLITPNGIPVCKPGMTVPCAYFGGQTLEMLRKLKLKDGKVKILNLEEPQK